MIDLDRQVLRRCLCDRRRPCGYQHRCHLDIDCMGIDDLSDDEINGMVELSDEPELMGRKVRQSRRRKPKRKRTKVLKKSRRPSAKKRTVRSKRTSSPTRVSKPTSRPTKRRKLRLFTRRKKKPARRSPTVRKGARVQRVTLQQRRISQKKTGRPITRRVVRRVVRKSSPVPVTRKTISQRSIVPTTNVAATQQLTTGEKKTNWLPWAAAAAALLPFI